jgi:poly(beta-D-mannuronate) lyase
MNFWEEALPGAWRGNLRAWAALAASATSATPGDPVQRNWAAWSTGYVLCPAAEDGSLPQEMRRGHLALQYQLHAIAPLVTSALLLERQGRPLAASCDGALHRVVSFDLDDLQTCERTRAITGETQSFFDGSDTLEGFHLAWLEAYLSLAEGPWHQEAEALAESYRPLGYSKLGGDQMLLWQAVP